MSTSSHGQSTSASAAFLRAVANVTTVDEVSSDIKDLDTRFRLLDTAHRTLEHQFTVIGRSNCALDDQLAAEKELSRALESVNERLEREVEVWKGVNGRLVGQKEELVKDATSLKVGKEIFRVELNSALKRNEELEEQIEEMEEMNRTLTGEKEEEDKK